MSGPAGPCPTTMMLSCRGCFSPASPPAFIRLLVRRPGACFIVWLAVPLILVVLMWSKIGLTDPLVGWRMKRHESTRESRTRLATRDMRPLFC